MTKLYKWIIGIVIGLLLLANMVQCIQKNSIKKDFQIQSVALVVANDSAKVYKDKYGATYSTLNSVLIDKDALRKSLDVAGITNKELKAKNIKLNDITEVLMAKLEVAGNANVILHDTVYVDSTGVKIPAKDFYWTNKYLTLNGLVKENNAEIKYLYQIGLDSYKTQNGDKVTYTIFSTDKENSKITNGYTITVRDKQPSKFWTWTWRVASFAGGYYLGSK